VPFGTSVKYGSTKGASVTNMRVLIMKEKRKNKGRRKTVRVKPPPLVENEMNSTPLARSNVLPKLQKIYQRHKSLISKVRNITQGIASVRACWLVIVWVMEKVT
jgi:hypothetical protein